MSARSRKPGGPSGGGIFAIGITLGLIVIAAIAATQGWLLTEEPITPQQTQTGTQTGITTVLTTTTTTPPAQTTTTTPPAQTTTTTTAPLNLNIDASLISAQALPIGAITVTDYYFSYASVVKIAEGRYRITVQMEGVKNIPATYLPVVSSPYEGDILVAFAGIGAQQSFVVQCLANAAILEYSSWQFSSFFQQETDTLIYWGAEIEVTFAA